MRSPRVGIPRALGYYYLYPFYRTFLEDLGAEVVVSPPTTKATLDRMESCPTDEPCVAVKLYFAHTERLIRMGVDLVFSPVLVSLEEGNYCCPKFLGISDMVRNGLDIADAGMLTPRLDYGAGSTEARRPFHEVASRLGVTDRRRIHTALTRAGQVQRSVELRMSRDGLTVPEAYALVDRGDVGEMGEWENGGMGDLSACMEGSGSGCCSLQSAVCGLSPAVCSLSCGLIGHPYILYDMLSHDMVDRLREYGRVVTAEMVSREAADEQIDGIHEGRRMWSFEAHMLGAALHLLRRHLVDKIILVGSFECGPESIIESYIEDEATRQGIPFLLLTVDEQTGEAGLLTRIEAFMDTAGGRQQGRLQGRLQTADCRLQQPVPLNSAPADRSPFPPFSHSPIPPREREREASRKGGATVLAPVKQDIVVGLPSMGYLDIAIRSMLQDCGTECVRTPRTSKRSIQLGSELAPEFVCFPLVSTLGQMREMIEAGANTIFMVGGKGRCRLGWYAQVQENLLRRTGADFDMIVLDSPFPLKTNWGPFRDGLKRLASGASWAKIIGAFRFGYRKMLALDEAEAACLKIRAYERERGAVDGLFDRFVRRIERASDMRTIDRVTREFREAVRAIEVEQTDPLKVRIIGEIWVVLEHMVNQQIEKLLASQDGIRVEVGRDLSASHWFRQNVFSDPSLKGRYERVVRAASRYLSEEVGGHGQESVGEAVLAREEGFDGVIHVFPFTCMPEVVAQNILVKVSEDLDIPVLTFIASEQTGEAGIQTRVEAFLDVLEERRTARRKGGTK